MFSWCLVLFVLGVCVGVLYVRVCFVGDVCSLFVEWVFVF